MLVQSVLLLTNKFVHTNVSGRNALSARFYSKFWCFQFSLFNRKKTTFDFVNLKQFYVSLSALSRPDITKLFLLPRQLGAVGVRISRWVFSEPSCCRYYVFLTLLFVSADGNCDFMLIKAWRTRVASQAKSCHIVNNMVVHMLVKWDTCLPEKINYAGQSKR